MSPRPRLGGLIALSLVLAALSPASSAASSQGLSTEALSGHQLTVPHCDTSVTAAITSVEGFGVTVASVELSDLEVGCDGRAYKVALVQADGSMLGAQVTGTFALAGCGAACTTSVSFEEQLLPFPSADHVALDIRG